MKIALFALGVLILAAVVGSQLHASRTATADGAQAKSIAFYQWPAHFDALFESPRKTD